MQSFQLNHANILGDNGWLENASLRVEQGKITALGQALAPFSGLQIDLQGQWLLPGIVDVHGDAFEREITPRAGTQFPLPLAFAANDRQLLANGITTYFCSITDGFEPGPRSRATVRQMLALLAEQRPQFGCQWLIHLRHELVNTDDFAELEQWLRSGQIQLLSLNDHLPDLANERAKARYLSGLHRRVALSEQDSAQLLTRLQAQKPLGLQQKVQLANIAQQAGVMLASHDDHQLAQVAENLQLGVRIAEFPMNMDVAKASRDAGIAVLMGAPNLVRGGSHVGAIAVADGIRQGLVDILCSDYHYASLFHAPFQAAALGLLPLAEAWQLVSHNPAQAVGLSNKGSLALGKDADLLWLKALNGLATDIQAVCVQGKLVTGSLNC